MNNFVASALFFGLASLICHGTALAKPFAKQSIAQIVPDTSVGTTITPNVEIKGVTSDRIDGGSIRGANLFHSFSEFNIQNGRGAYFSNPQGITNIFSRITGNNPSNINGILGVLGNANLFLLNPNGIIFGPNARLDLNASFIGTTANSIRFADGVEFSATNPSASPLLTVSVPIGLQMGTNPAPITVQGSGHDLTAFDPVFAPYQRSQPNAGLQVGAGATLGFIGGDITLPGGILTAPAGTIVLGSIGPSSTPANVGMQTTSQGWQFNYDRVPSLGDINLSQGALLDVNHGAISLTGRNISLQNGSLALIQNESSTTAGTIEVNASGVLSLVGMSANQQVRSGLENQTLAMGDGGSIQVRAADVEIEEGAGILVRSFSAGKTGDITINASGHIQAIGSNPPLTANSAIGNLLFDSGDAGQIQITTHQLELLDSGIVTSATFGTGNGGNISVDVTDSIVISGFNPLIRTNSAIGGVAFGNGNSGTVSVNANRITLSNQGLLTTGSFNQGNAGSVIVNAAESIEILGDVTAIGSSIEILPAASRAIFRLPDVPNGSAGNVTVNTQTLRIHDKGQLSVRNDGVGDAGILTVNAHAVNLFNNGRISALASAGEGGNINLQTQSLILRQRSSMAATAAQQGNGGNITIYSPTIVGLENSDIIANAFQGNGGRINITTQGIFGLENRPQLTSESDITASSQFGVSGTINVSVLNFNQQNVVAPPPSNFVSTDQVVASSCAASIGKSQGSFVVTGNGGLPETPETATIPYQVVQVLATETSQATPRQQESKPTPTATSSWQPGDPIVEATEFSVNARGQVVLTANGNTGTGTNAQLQPIPCQPN